MSASIAQEFIEKEEGRANRYRGFLKYFVTGIALAMTAFHLYIAYGIVPTHIVRAVHVGFVFILTFLLYPVATRFRDRFPWFDAALVALGTACIAYLLAGGDDFADRATSPGAWDLFFGVALIVLVIEAARRTSGWIMPVVVLAFLAYALAGPWLPAPWTHRGYDVARLVGHMYMTLEGVFGVAVDVSATLIALFTIYGAILQYSGAGRFFLDFSLGVMGRKRAGAGRTVVLSSFLLGGPSGSGVATTVTIGAVAWPMLRRAGYDRNAAGGLLAAGGLGAIISPPVLGAAAFLIAEFLKISYLDVLQMVAIPTLLYYFSLFLMVELDARRQGAQEAAVETAMPLWTLVRSQWFHFLSLFAIIAFMLWGFSPALAVFWATVLAVGTSYFSRESALGPSKLVESLSQGALQVVGVAATCAAAGLIVGVVTLTGLGLKFSSIVIDYAGGSLALTAVYTALIVWIVGLAVPVTASYIICAVITAPALITLGVPDYAAHMFIFYYAVLSEVSPPTALSPFAAAAITGGDPYKTTLQSWKYTLPAFVVPFAFVLTPAGQGLLLKGSGVDIAYASASVFAGIAFLAIAASGWLRGSLRAWQRLLLGLAGACLMLPTPRLTLLGFALAVPVLAHAAMRKRTELGYDPR
jgi:TRAP transporter 4TM/12TM fusion protein